MKRAIQGNGKARASKTSAYSSYTNLATPLAPVWRRRIRLPLTPRAVRMEMLEAGDIRLTPLDRMLSDEEADALEQYAAMEEVLSGSTRAQDYLGDKRGKSSGMSPLPDYLLRPLHLHAVLKNMMSIPDKNALYQFCLQQWRAESAMSDAELGIIVAPKDKDKAAAWRTTVVYIAKRIVKLRSGH